MTQNINIRFIGNANFGPVAKELGTVAGQFEALSAAMKAASVNSNGMIDTKWVSNLNAKVAQQRALLTQSISAMGDFGVKSLTVADHVDTLTEKIKKQKFGVSDLIREHKSLRDVYRQQLANRNSTVVEWGRNADGSVNADVITRNRNATEFTNSLRNARMEMGFYNQVLGSVADQTVKWGKNTQWAGRQLMAGITYPVAAAGAATAALAYQVDKGLTQVVKVYGDASTALTTSDEQIKRQTMETARNMASSIGQSVNDTLQITAELAATGQTGQELQRATAEVSRARVLGELNVQDAMQATMTLQSVYNMNSQQLADTFNYMNSMENQTKLTMQDFVVGIPKVSGVIKELGGDVREVGTLLAAMKIAGIDAAEGANAIKSIAFKTAAQGNGAKDMFQSLVGQSYESVVGETTDVTKRLILIGKAMKEAQLSATEKTGLIAKMFGLYQGSKALSIISQLTDGSEQMNRALEVSAQTTQEWAETADRELNKLTNSNWNRVQQMWQTLKIDLAAVGEEFLGLAIPVMQFIGSIVSGFNSLDDGAKKWIVRLLAVGAAIGPLIMLAGLMGNLIGNVGKFTSFLTALVFRFKVLTDEEITQERMSRIIRKSTNEQAAAYAGLAKQIQYATAEMARFTAQQLVVAGKNPALINGAYPPLKPLDGTFDEKGKWTPAAASAAGAAAAGGLAGQTDKATKSWTRLNKASAVFGTVAVAGLVSATSETGSLVNNLANAAFIAASMAPLLTGLKGPISSLVARIGDVSKVTGSIKGGFAAARAGAMGLASSFLTIAPALAAAGLAIGGIYYVVNQNLENSRKKVEAFSNSAKGYAEVVGFSYQDVGSKIDAVGNKVETLNTKVQKFKDTNKEALEIMNQYAGSEEQILQRAADEGAKAAMHGASPEQAKEAAMIAAKAMGSALSEEQLSAKIDAIIDFGDSKKVVDRTMNDIQQQISKATENGFKNGWENFFSNGSNLTGSSEQALKDNVKAMMEVYNSASEEDRSGILSKFQSSLVNADRATFDAIKKNHEKEFAQMGINDLAALKEAASNARAGVDPQANPDLKVINLTGEEYDNLSRRMFANNTILETLKQNTGNLTQAQLDGIHTLDQWREATGNTKASMGSTLPYVAQWVAWQKRAEASGAKWTEQEKLTRLNIWRAKAGLDEAKTSAQGFSDAITENGNKMEDWTGKITDVSKAFPSLVSQLSQNSQNAVVNLADEGNADMMFNSYKDTYTGAMSNIFSTASALAQNQIQDMNDRIAASFDAAREKLDNEQKAAEKAFDNKTKRFDNDWENRMDAFAKKWDRRKESTAAKYDKQIEKIKETIQAEQDAEAVRQKIFEAEKTRISRLAEMQNRSIDFASALRSGKMDEAAKISNDAAAAEAGWILDDAAASSGDNSKTRQDKLNDKADALTKQKDARLKALDDVEAREKKQLEDRKEREKELLDAQKEAMQEGFAAKKKDLDRREKAEQRANQRSQEREQRLLEAKLAALKAWVPKDEKELAQHTKAVEAAYKEFGIDLKASGREWSGVVGKSLTDATTLAAKKMSNDIAWNEMGRLAAENMTQGAFSMTLSDFIKWVAGGQMPSSAKVGASNKHLRAVKQKNGSTKWIWGESQGGLTRHEGGMIGPGGKNKRTGFAGKGPSNSEVPVTALVGEAVLNRRAVKNIGADGIDYLNRWGGIPEGFGWGGPSGTSAMGNIGFGGIMQGFRRGIAEAGIRKLNADAAAPGPMEVGGDASTPMFPGGWKRPAAGPITSHFGYRFHPTLKTWRLHGGSDIGAPSGSPIYAAKGGTVVSAGPNGSYGNYTMINHGAGIATGYAHQSVLGVRAGQAVRTGQQIGRVGTTGRSTGPHLHFEYMKNGVRANPNLIIPGLKTGGYVVKEGLAKLHEEETVLPKPLTRDFQQGVKNFASNDAAGDTNNFNFYGDINGIDDLEGAVNGIMDRRDSRIGDSRRRGGRRS